MNTFLRDLALAHQNHEGFYPGSYSYRQNNPGNLRGANGAFVVFKTYEQGLAALEADLKAKILGTANSIKRYMKKSGKTYEDLVFLDYVSIYAPSADHNNPSKYCEALCYQLMKYGLHPSTPLSIMAQLIRGEIDRAPDTELKPIPVEIRLKMAENALKWAKGPRRNMLIRFINRVKKAL